MIAHVTTLAVWMMSAAVVASVLDWFAVARRITLVEYVAKPAAAIGFVATAAALDPVDSTARAVLVVALVFSVAGDVFLMLPRDAFVPGLASFAVAQVLFALSFALREPTAIGWIIGVVIVAPTAAVLGRRFIGALARTGQRSLMLPVAVYMVVISAMVIASIAVGNVVGIIGSCAFLISDSLIAEERFVAQRRWQPVTIIVTYHVALAGLVLALV